MKQEDFTWLDHIVDETQKNSANFALVAATLALIPSLMLSLSIIAFGNSSFNVGNMTKISESPYIWEAKTNELTKFLMLMVSRTQKSIISFAASAIFFLISKFIPFNKNRIKFLARFFVVLALIGLFLGFLFLLIMPNFYIRGDII